MIAALQISSLEALCRAVAERSRIRLQPVGGGSHLHRGYRPRGETQPISAPFLNTVVDYPHEDLTITVGSHLGLAELQGTLAERGQWLPPAWGSQSVTVGGWLGADTRGPLAGGWGTARDHVLRVQWVNGKGDVLTAGAPVVKSVAGYDFMKLMIGSLGELGFITEVTLKVLPRLERWVSWVYPQVTPELTATLLDHLRLLAPCAANIRRESRAAGNSLHGYFAGSEERTSYCSEILLQAASPHKVITSDQPPVFPFRNSPATVWGGVLAEYSLPFSQACSWGDSLEVDLLGGHVWLQGGEVPTGEELESLRSLAAVGEGHLHVDSLAEPSWGREVPGEVELQKKIKAALDPQERWVCGRLPGRV